MYISILDYSRQSVVIINDTENACCGLNNDEMEMVLSMIGFHPSEINWMTTDEDPYEQVSDYVTLRDLCEEVGEEILEEVCRQINVSAEDLTHGEEDEDDGE